MEFFDYFSLKTFDFVGFDFFPIGLFKDFVGFFNTFFLSNFVDLDYGQPFLYREIPLKEFYFKDFNYKDYDYIYQHNHSSDYFFSCWYIDSYFDLFNTALYTDFANNLTHSFLQDKGLEEVVRLDLRNKFKANVDSSFFDYTLIQKDFFVNDFFVIENISNFDNFLLKSESKFNDLYNDFLSFYNYFFESKLALNNIKLDFFFNDVIKLESLNSLFLLYNSSLILYDRLAYLYCFDFFFLSLFDICKTYNLNFCYFFEEMGNLLMFLEHFSNHLGFLLFNFSFYKSPEFFIFFEDSFLFFSNEFSNFFPHLISFKNFIYYLAYLNFFDLQYFELFNSFLDFSIFDSF